MNFLEENSKQIITSEQPILSEVLIRKTFTGSEFKLSLIARIYTSDLLQTNSRSLEITLSLYSFFHKLLAYSLPRIRSWGGGVGWGGPYHSPRAEEGNTTFPKTTAWEAIIYSTVNSHDLFTCSLEMAGTRRLADSCQS